MDLSKLDDEQIKVALKVISSAKKHGINPDFVLPMVSQESAFKPDAKSSAGAIGPMQLMPGTAKELGVDPANVDENIEGGMRYLKGLVENKRLGGDPRNIFAAYNAGPNHKFFETGDLNDLPDETIKHVVTIMGAYGDNVPDVTITPTEPEKMAPEPSAGPEDQYSGETIPTEPTQAEQNRSAKEMGAVGAAVGAGAGSVYAAKAPIFRMAQRVGLLPGGKPISPADAASLVEKIMTPSQPAVPEARPAPAAVDTTTAPTSPRKTHGGENWQKSLTGISTPGAQMDKSSLDLAKRMQSTVGIGGSPGFTGGTITEGGVILSPRDAAAVQARQQAAAAQAARAEALQQAAAARQAGINERMQQVLGRRSAENEARMRQTLHGIYGQDSAQRAARMVLGSAPVRAGLAGLGIGFNAQDAYNQFQQGNVLGGSLATGAAGASGLSLVPKLAPVMGPAAVGLTTAAQVAGDLRRGDRQGAAESGLSGLTALFPRFFGPLGAAVYSRGLNEGEMEELERRRKMAPTISP